MSDAHGVYGQETLQPSAILNRLTKMDLLLVPASDQVIHGMSPMLVDVAE
jgi:hypothetical protein